MNLETHPVFHYILELLFYNIGLLMNVLIAAHLATSAKTNTVKTIREFFALRWIPLAVRWTICIFLFLVVWENPRLGVNALFEKIADSNSLVHLGASGFFGFACDEIFSKFLALIGMQKELPAVPDANQNTP